MNFKISDSEKYQQNLNQFYIGVNSAETDTSTKYYSLSATIHAGLLLITSLIVVPISEKLKTETITIEITDQQLTKASLGTNVPATQGGEFVKEKIPAKVMNRSSSRAGKNSSPGAVKIQAGQIGRVDRIEMPQDVVAREARIDDLDDEDIENSLNSVSSQKLNQLNDNEVDQDFEKVNQKIRSMNSRSRELLTQELDDEAAATDEVLKQAGIANQKHSIAREKLRQALLQKDQQAISQARENEKQAALAAAAAARKAEAARLRAEQIQAAEYARARARQQRLSENGGNGNRILGSGRDGAEVRSNHIDRSRVAGTGDGAGRSGVNSGGSSVQSTGDGAGLANGRGLGAGNNGSPQSGTELAGVPNGVRTLEQLRQMPGNPKPQYSSEERLNGHQGQVAFLAYVDGQGRLSRFKQIRSTGFYNLDQKTLEALKKWRFYPGQQGWVELPLKWQLKGGAQETRSILRANNSQTQKR